MPALPMTPLADAEHNSLADLLDLHGPVDYEGALGVMNAIAVAPGLVPPSEWLPLVMPETEGLLEGEVKVALGWLLRLYNEVNSAINEGEVIIPEADDIEACKSFAAGFAAGATLDPMWAQNDDHWTFAEHIAYLGGRLDLVDDDKIDKFDHFPDFKDLTRRDMGAIIMAANRRFTEVRREAMRSKPTGQAGKRRRVGRNEPCPCGSGKKYKRCCIDADRGRG